MSKLNTDSNEGQSWEYRIGRDKERGLCIYEVLSSGGRVTGWSIAYFGPGTLAELRNDLHLMLSASYGPEFNPPSETAISPVADES